VARCLAAFFGRPGTPNSIDTARRGGRLVPRSAGPRPPASGADSLATCRSSILGRRDLGDVPDLVLPVQADLLIAASSRSICLQPGSRGPEPANLRRPSRRLPGHPGDPADPSNVRLPLYPSQVIKPQHLVVSCGPQLPHLGLTPVSAEVAADPMDPLRNPCGRPVDRFTCRARARRSAAWPSDSAARPATDDRTCVPFYHG
jgi:hypothetical protein